MLFYPVDFLVCGVSIDKTSTYNVYLESLLHKGTGGPIKSNVGIMLMERPNETVETRGTFLLVEL